LTNEIQLSIPANQIEIVLSCIIGNSGSITHGGLIERAFAIDRSDWAQGFLNTVKSMIKRAENDNISLTFIRGYLIDIIEYFKIEESTAILNDLRSKNHSENFYYYKEGANEGNIFAMRMLAKYYIEGQGSEVNIEQAKYWLTKAADLGNELARKELLELR
jgi:TPR repeat protein